MSTSERTAPAVSMQKAALIALKRGDAPEEVRTSLLAVAALEHADVATVERAVALAQATLAREKHTRGTSH